MNAQRTVLLGLIVVLALLSSCLGLATVRNVDYIPGTYTGSGEGYRGRITVSLQLSESGIEDIVITSHQEAAYPGASAMEELLELVLEYGSTEVDVVSGATYSSFGFLDAVEAALQSAALAARQRTLPITRDELLEIEIPPP